MYNKYFSVCHFLAVFHGLCSLKYTHTHTHVHACVCKMALPFPSGWIPALLKKIWADRSFSAIAESFWSKWHNILHFSTWQYKRTLTPAWHANLFASAIYTSMDFQIPLCVWGYRQQIWHISPKNVFSLWLGSLYFLGLGNKATILSFWYLFSTDNVNC